jgi:FlaG/FlaF family flagellin (archaellin)
MKNFRLLIILFAFITLVSACKKDDEKPQTTEQRILGKWNIKKSTDKYYENNVLKTSSEETASSGDYVEFNSNKSLVVFEDGDLSSGSYQILNDNSMTFSVDGFTSTVTIDKLDSKQFIITTSFSQTQDGITYKYVSTVEMAK